MANKCIFLGFTNNNGAFGCISKKHPGYRPDLNWCLFGNAPNAVPQHCWSGGNGCPVFQRENSCR